MGSRSLALDPDPSGHDINLTGIAEANLPTHLIGVDIPNEVKDLSLSVQPQRPRLVAPFGMATHGK